MNILNVGYKSANYYLIGPDANRLLIDVGWPGTLPLLLSQAKRKDVSPSEVKHLLVTHVHPDHAGLAQELKEQGVRFIVMDNQVSAISQLRRYMKPSQHYHEIVLDDNIQLNAAGSRAFLQRNGLAGEIVYTPGHSDDSVTLILDEGQAFTGDLTSPGFATKDSQRQVEQSWSEIRSHRVKTIYPGHGPARPLE